MMMMNNKTIEDLINVLEKLRMNTETNELELASRRRTEHDLMKYGDKPWYDVTNREVNEEAERKRLSKLVLVAQLRAWKPEHKFNYTDAFMRPTLAKVIALSLTGETNPVVLSHGIDLIVGVLTSGSKGVTPTEEELEELIISVNDL